MNSDESKQSSFPSTHWSLVNILRHGSEAEVNSALETICRRYWYPIYAFLRSTGYTPTDAEDLTQSFFQRLISQEVLGNARERRGKLRSFLLGVLKHHIGDQNRHDGRLKRGGGRKVIEFDEVAAEERYAIEPQDVNSPDKFFDRAWAVNVLTDASARLREVFVEGDNETAYEHLREFLPLGGNDTPYREVAARLGIRESSVRLQVHRMRQRYRELIEDSIRDTIAEPSAIEEELEYLMSLMTGSRQ